MRRLLALVTAIGVALGVAGCTTTAPDDGRIRVVASTNVWGNIAETIGGDRVNVFSLIRDDSQDPHEYAAGANDLLQVSHAAVILENGNGYDDVLRQLVTAANATGTVITVSDLVDTGVDNEHYWFYLAAVATVADALCAEFSTIEPAHASDFAERNAAFQSQITLMQARVAAIAAAHPNRAALLSEPLPYYLLTAAGFTDATPPALSVAVEAGTEIPPSALNRSLTMLTNHEVNLLAVNAQTDSAQVEQLITQARRTNVSVIEFRELLPPHSNYVDWMNGYIDDIAKVS